MYPLSAHLTPRRNDATYYALHCARGAQTAPPPSPRTGEGDRADELSARGPPTIPSTGIICV